MNANEIVTLATWVVVFIIGASWWSRAVENDPTFNCKRYLKKGCPHVDGIACDMKTCSIKDVV